MADVFMCEKLADSGKSMGGNAVALFCSGFMETYCPFHKVLHRFDRISKSFQSTTGGGPRIVGPRWISGENICMFLRVSFFRLWSSARIGYLFSFNFNLQDTA